MWGPTAVEQWLATSFPPLHHRGPIPRKMRWIGPAILLALGPSTPAMAGGGPCRLCRDGDALTAPQENAAPMALQVETSLDFDRVILTGSAGGTAQVGPDGGRATSGALAPMTGRAMNGEVEIRGEPGRAVRVEL